MQKSEGCFFIFINGAYCKVISRGRGRDALLLHGYKSCADSFYYQIKALEQNGFRAVAPDMPGFGSSAALTSAWSVGDYADWLEKFVAAAGLENPCIVAHSFGARVAIKYLSRNKSGAQKLLIVGGAGVVKPRSPRYIRRVKAYRRIKKIFPRLAERAFGSREYRSLTPLERESYKLIVNEDLRDDARRICAPTLLVYGKDDKVTPIGEEGEIFRSAIAGSRLVETDGGHFCFCERAEEFNKIMLGFFRGD